MDPIQNPYRPGAGTQPRALTGRDKLLADFEITLARAMAREPGKSVMPIGLRGVGKTVLLRRFADQAIDLGYKVGFIEAPETDELPRQIAGHVRSMLYEFDKLHPLSETVGRAFRVLKSFSVTVPGGVEFALNIDPERGRGDSGDLTRDLTDLLISVGQVAAKHQSGILLAIDELQYTTERNFAALITAMHQCTQVNLPIVLVGAGLPQLPGLAGEAKSYAERLFEFPRVGSLNREDAFKAIADPAKALGVSYQPQALELIHQETHGYPYFLQEWAYHVWNEANLSPIAGQVVIGARDRIRRALDENFFQVRFDRLTPTERRYLRAMAQLGPGPHQSSAVAHAYGAKIETVAPLRSRLITKGMIYSRDYGETAFTVPLFDEYLKRALPFERAHPRERDETDLSR